MRRAPHLAAGVTVLLAAGISRAEPRGFVEPVSTDAPPRTMPPALPPAHFAPTWDLDGFYLWLGPSGAASYVASQWDTTFGADLSLLRVREHAGVGAIGASLGAARWTERGGGRIWLDGVLGTELGGHMVGVSAGPILELSDLAHPRGGGSVGIWGFVGVTPYARIGEVDGLGTFVELGVHIALPVFRRH
jgi:hypothetical protein